jgi:tRNA1(Val) A37 N6-methylase TrmN6
VRAICLDATDLTAFAAAGIGLGAADHVLMNPPFNPLHNVSPDRARRLAHSTAPGALAVWADTAAQLLRSGAVLTLIWRADGLGDVLTTLGRGFGAIAILPLHPRPGAAAIRVLVRAVKASKAPLAVLPGLILAGLDGKPTAQTEAIMRDGTAVDFPDG